MVQTVRKMDTYCQYRNGKHHILVATWAAKPGRRGTWVGVNYEHETSHQGASTAATSLGTRFHVSANKPIPLRVSSESLHALPPLLIRPLSQDQICGSNLKLPCATFCFLVDPRGGQMPPTPLKSLSSCFISYYTCQLLQYYLGLHAQMPPFLHFQVKVLKKKNKKKKSERPSLWDNQLAIWPPCPNLSDVLSCLFLCL